MEAPTSIVVNFLVSKIMILKVNDYLDVLTHHSLPVSYYLYCCVGNISLQEHKARIVAGLQKV